MKAGTASFGQAPGVKGSARVSTVRKSMVSKIGSSPNRTHNQSESEEILN